MKNSHAALAAGFVTLSVAIAYFLLRTPDEPADLSRFDDAPAVHVTEDDAPLGDVDLADGGTATGAPEPAIETEPAAPTRTAIDDALDGRTWADLLFPVDDRTGAPIEGGHVIHVDAKGVRTVRPLASVVRTGDLDARTAAALDTDHHCPRAFFPEELADVDSGPLHVRMFPSAQVRLEVIGDAPDPLPKLTFTTNGFENWDREPDEVRELGFEHADELDPLLAFAPTLAHVLSEGVDERSRRRQIKWAERTESVHPMFDLRRDPLAFVASNAALVNPPSLPRTIDDLPDGYSVSLSLDSTANVLLVDADGVEHHFWMAKEYTLDAEGPIVVSVRFLGEATVVGRVPERATSVEVDVELVDDDDGDGEFEWWGWNEAELADDGGFRVEGLRPGHQRLTATWTDELGLRQRAEASFEVEAGETHDVGLLEPAGGALISIVPVLVVDGEIDPSRLGGRIDPTSWSVWLSPVSGLDEVDWSALEEWQLEDEAFMSTFLESIESQAASGTDFSASADGFDPIHFAGVPPGRYDLALWDPELPEDVTESYRFAGWEIESVIDVGGDARYEARLLMVPATPCPVSVEVPAGGENVMQSVRALAWNAVTEEVVEVEFESSMEFGTSASWTASGSVSLGPGTWTIVAVVDAEDMEHWDEQGADGTEVGQVELVRHTGRGEVEVSGGLGRSVTIRAAPAASVRGGGEGFGLDEGSWFGWVELVPVGAPASLSGMWIGYEEDEDGRVTVEGLLPDTEYRVADTDKVVRTGAAGSLTEL
ncbi:hypothetical protein Pla163_03300 [Planctomycetes bacterium Pla163]|uniref:Uncharacterized protein n=1 Tax=Rohdeia mirabilis TaxID=2528008 RepID=A0A518CVH6_9BACT|nr:hypothetical protein Pla163_03300 [Planctomycetes bacterium Pla163]